MKKLFVFLMSALPLYAKDCGVEGHTFPIQEPDFLKQIEDKLESIDKNGELEILQKKALNKAQNFIRRPQSVHGITHTHSPRIFVYDPSVTVPYDLKDHHGRVFHKAGTRVNPLTMKSLSTPLVFIDGDDLKQVQWALTAHAQAKIVLIKGSPFELMELYERPFYFDQQGVLVKKLGIKQVPAVVKQSGLALEISEIAMEKK